MSNEVEKSADCKNDVICRFSSQINNEMSEQEQKKMWEIDLKAQLGDKLTEEEKKFFNANYEKMKEQMLDNWTHWQFHSGRL